MNPMKSPWRLAGRLLPALLAPFCTTAVQAQSQAVNLAPNTLPYRSVFDGYQKFKDQAIASWPQSMTNVQEKGGWRAYLKEAQAAQVPAKGHAGHGTQP